MAPPKKILAPPLDPLTNLNSYCHCSNISTINQGIQSIFQPRPPIKTIGHSNFCHCSNHSNSCENVTLFPSSYPAWQFVQPFLFMCYGFFLTLFWSISATKDSLLTPWQQPDRFSLLFSVKFSRCFFLFFFTSPLGSFCSSILPPSSVAAPFSSAYNQYYFMLICRLE